MALTVTVSRGYTMVAGAKLDVDDWNAAFLPTITIVGGVGGADLADDAIGANHLGANIINGLSAITALASGDKVMVFDASAADNAAITVANFINGVFSLAATVATTFTSYTADKVTFHNGTEAQTMSPAILAEQLVAQAPTLTATDDADEVGLHDASAADGSRFVRVTLANLLPNKGTAGTYTGVTGFDVDTKGRVVTVYTTGAGQIASTADGSLVALPTGVGSANQISIPHGLGSKPRRAWVSLVCTDAAGDAGYAQNNELDITAVVFDDASGDYNPHYVVKWDATNIVVMQPDSAGSVKRIPHGSTGVMTAFDPTKWKARGFAIK